MKLQCVVISVAAATILAQTSQIKAGVGEAYELFNKFCVQHFSAEGEALVYETFGTDLKFVKTGNWQHVSETSSAIAFETNLPSKAYIEYGPTEKYGSKTTVAERNFYLHLHYLKGLKPGRPCHYRLVATDERGNTIRSKDRTFTTKCPANVIRIPQDLSGPPYVLAKPGATYLVTQDLTIDGLAFDVTANNVTLDLGGNKVIYDNKHWGKIKGDFWAYVRDSKFGVRANKISGLSVYNGAIIQGAGNDAATPGLGYNPFYLRGCSKVEVAGVTISYSGSQQIGIYNHWCGADRNHHHNVFLDRGSSVLNRHGSGSKSIISGDKCHHNLVRRTRQGGLMGSELFDNEIYIDSYVTNSFGLGGKVLHGNRVFGAGYHVCAIGWSNGMKAYGNYLQLHAEALPDERSKEFGEAASLNGIRLTQYNRARKPFHNNLYYDNVIVIKSKDGRQARGVQFCSHSNVKNLICRDSVMKVEALDTKTENVASIVAHGYSGKDIQPLYYRNCTLVSNICNVRFGDDYSRGSNHHLENCRFLRTGNDPKYHTFVFDGGWWTGDHVVLDCRFEPGTRYDDVYWRQVSAESNYSVAWTLSIATDPGADVGITDKTGQEVFKGKADGAGKVSVALKQCVIRPKEWTAGATKQPAVKLKLEHQKVMCTPHKVTVRTRGKERSESVTMDKAKNVDMRL